MLAAVSRAGLAEAGELCVCDMDPQRRELLAREYGFHVVADARDVLAASCGVLLAVKPQNLDEVLDEISDCVTPEHLLISIAAGKRLAGIAARLPAGSALVRVMPNLPAVVGAGMRVFCRGFWRVPMSIRSARSPA